MFGLFKRSTQRSQAWYLARLGLPTASCYKLIMSDGIGRYAYLEQLLEERLTGLPTIFAPYNEQMVEGVKLEPVARMRYTLLTGRVLKQYDFVKHHIIDTGASPDAGIVGHNAGLEIKCPGVRRHRKNCMMALKKRLPAQYRAQLQGQMWIMGWDYIDFMSFNPNVPKQWQVAGIRVYRDDEYIAQLASRVVDFLHELQYLEQQARSQGL